MYLYNIIASYNYVGYLFNTVARYHHIYVYIYIYIYIYIYSYVTQHEKTGLMYTKYTTPYYDTYLLYCLRY